MKIAFNKRLQILLAESGMSQEDAARHLGVSASTMSRWVRGIRVPSAYQLRNLVHFFGLPYEWFLEGMGMESIGVCIVREPEFNKEDKKASPENFVGDEDFDLGPDEQGVEEMAVLLGLSSDTVEALMELAGTEDVAVLESVDNAVRATVSAVNAAYTDMMSTVEQSLKIMMEKPE